MEKFLGYPLDYVLAQLDGKIREKIEVVYTGNSVSQSSSSLRVIKIEGAKLYVAAFSTVPIEVNDA